MPKTTDELLGSKGGSSVESNGFGGQERPQNPAGLYRHEKSGAEIITKWHPLFGSAQADGAVRVGYEFVRPATAEELREKIDYTTPIGPAASSASSDDIKGIMARLNDLEAENAQLKAEQVADENPVLGDNTNPKEEKKADK